MRHSALNASLDHDACGVGFIVQLRGEATRDVVQRALVALVGDDRKNPRYIQTVPKQGYRFLEQVRSGSGGYKLSTSAGRIRTFGRSAPDS